MPRKKEGTLTLYTTIAEKDLPTLIKPFEIEIRRQGERVARGHGQACCSEPSRKRRRRSTTSTSIHFGSPEMEALSREKVLLPVTSPVHKDLQPGSVPPHRQWAATLLSVWVQVYNTKLVKKESLPKTYKDLLDPKWKGKLGIEAKDEDWFASVVDVMGGGETGLKFFRDLVATNGLSVRQGHTLLNNMVISGEVPLALNDLQLHAGAGQEEGRADRLVRPRAGDRALERRGRRAARAASERRAAVLRIPARRRTAVLREHGLRAQQHEGRLAAQGHQDRADQSRARSR